MATLVTPGRIDTAEFRAIPTNYRERLEAPAAATVGTPRHG